MSDFVFVDDNTPKQPSELDHHFEQLHERLKIMTSILEKIHDELLEVARILEQQN
ncbi:hypothetical protein ACSHWG_02495 [Leucobacter sp. Z1108]|uniref:hypothetical protein n=1 Tax=Leucobacter sp. Z1108 TaxID=3439066 RepID=UPI003F40371E